MRTRRWFVRAILSALGASTSASRFGEAASGELARVTPPAAGRWHTMRLVAVGDRMQAWLDGVLSLDHRDSRFKAGRVGLWTKADSVTAFDDLVIRGVQAGP